MKRQNILILFFIAVAAIGMKAWLITGEALSFNSDEAVVALMARHILQGERPIFFYGQAYMGSLDAWLVAGGFLLWGQHVWVIRLVQTVLYLGTILTTYRLGKDAFGSTEAGLIAAGLLAIPTVNVSLYTSVSLGGYGEALLIGNLILLIALAIGRRKEKIPVLLWMAWGFLVGLGLWAFGLTLIYSLPAGIYLLWVTWRGSRDSKELKGWAKLWGLALLAALIGSLPWWAYAVNHGIGLLVWELSGGAISGVEPSPYLFRVFQHVFNLLLLGSTVTLGLRPPWSAQWLAMPLIPVVLAFWLGTWAFAARRVLGSATKRHGQFLVLGVIATLLAAFVFTPFGSDPSGRYFVPLAVPLALFAADLLLHMRDYVGRWAWAAFASILVFNFWGTVQSARSVPPGITTQFYAPAQIDHRYDAALIDFLQANGETRGYGSYWVTYPLAFHTEEALIFVPRLPYHLDFRYTRRDDRYAPYDDLVEQSDRVAYITTNNPPLDDYLRSKFGQLDMTWDEEQIGDYRVFYDLSGIVRPAEIGLDGERPVGIGWKEAAE